MYSSIQNTRSIQFAFRNNSQAIEKICWNKFHLCCLLVCINYDQFLGRSYSLERRGAMQKFFNIYVDSTLAVIYTLESWSYWKITIGWKSRSTDVHTSFSAIGTQYSKMEWLAIFFFTFVLQFSGIEGEVILVHVDCMYSLYKLSNQTLYLYEPCGCELKTNVYC